MNFKLIKKVLSKKCVQERRIASVSDFMIQWIDVWDVRSQIFELSSIFDFAYWPNILYLLNIM